jgi:hypothetical protein
MAPDNLWMESGGIRTPGLIHRLAARAGHDVPRVNQLQVSDDNEKMALYTFRDVSY